MFRNHYTPRGYTELRPHHHLLKIHSELVRLRSSPRGQAQPGVLSIGRTHPRCTARSGRRPCSALHGLPARVPFCGSGEFYYTGLCVVYSQSIFRRFKACTVPGFLGRWFSSSDLLPNEDAPEWGPGQGMEGQRQRMNDVMRRRDTPADMVLNPRRAYGKRSFE